jgi:flavin reductase (DIM6/NTAB) family NADH-FMN oxidoreductase RutF
VKKSFGAKTLAFPTPAWVVGTYDAVGKPNIMTVAWGGICCSKPPCVAISVRKATATYGNIIQRQAFTLNMPSERLVKEVDHAGLVSGRDEDKFAVLGLTPVKSDLVDAPYVAQFPLVLECRVLHTLEIGLHTQFVGEILDVKADDSVLDAAGLLDMERLGAIVFAPLQRVYFGLGKRLGAAFSIGKETAAVAGMPPAQE